MPLLDLVVSVWRMLPSGGVGGFSETTVYGSIRCAIVPISSFDSQVPYAYQSTHLIFVPHWIALRKEDQIRYGRRLPDAAGDISPWVYVLNGRRRTTQGVPQIAWYGTERD